MNIINELRELKQNTTNHHLSKKGIVLSNGYVQINDSFITIFIKDVSKKINITNTEIIQGISNDENVILVCKIKNVQDGYYLLRFDIVNDSITSYTISSLTELNNPVLIIDNNILYFLINNKYILTINLNSINNLVTANISKYPAGKRVVADIISKTYLGDFNFCNYMMLYNYKLYIPIENSDKAIEYDIKTGYIKQSIFNLENNFIHCLGIVQCGEKNDYADKNAVTIIVYENKVLLVDMTDFSGYILENFNDEIINSYVLDEDTLHVYSSNVYSINLKTFECTYTYISENLITDLKMLLINKTLYFENLTKSYTLNTVNNVCYLTVSCLDDNGDSLKTYNDMLKKKGKIQIKAKDIDGYKVMQYNTYEANTDEDFVDINFFYQRVDDLLNLNVTHLCDESVLSTMLLKGRVGDTYNITPININGYTHDYSVNNVGVYSEDMEECKIYYKSSNNFVTNSPNKTYICINCMCDGKPIIKKYISATKGNNVELNAPSIPCYTPIKQVITIEQVNYDIYNVYIEYTKISDNITVKYYYLNKLIYEDKAPVVGNIATVTPPDFLTIAKNEYDVENMTELKITCNPKDNSTLLNIIDDNTSKILYTIYENGDSDIFNNPVIEKYKYKAKNITTLPKMKVINMYYNQYIFDITFIHILNDFIIKEEKISSTDKSLVKATILNEYNNGEEVYKIEPISETSYKIDGSDKTIKINYEKKKIKIIAEILNADNVLLDTQIFIFDYGQPQIINIKLDRNDIAYKDTEINTDVDISNLNKEKLTYIVGNIKPNVNVSYTNGNILFNTNTPHNNFITRIKKNGSYLKEKDIKIYITKDLYKNNISTKRFLDGLNIEYIEIDTEQVKDIEDYSILIDGNYETKECFLSNFENKKIQYIPLNINYIDLQRTVTYATYTSLNLKSKDFNTITVNDDFFVSSVKYNKNNKRLYCSLTHIPNHSNFESYEIETIDIRECNVVHSDNIQVNTIHNFNKAVFTFSNNQNTQPDYNTITDKNNVSYYNKDSEYVIDTILHCYLVDTLGNRTKLIHEPIVYNLTTENTQSVFNKKYYTHSLDRYNHRFNGPRESYKYINTYYGIHSTCEDIEEKLVNINNNCDYNNDTLIEVDDNE